MLAKQGLIIFLVGTNSHCKGSLAIYSIAWALNDFLEQFEDELRELTKDDYEEVERIKKNPFLLTESYLFNKIEPFLLPFYERRNSTSL